MSSEENKYSVSLWGNNQASFIVSPRSMNPRKNRQRENSSIRPISIKQSICDICTISTREDSSIASIPDNNSKFFIKHFESSDKNKICDLMKQRFNEKHLGKDISERNVTMQLENIYLNLDLNSTSQNKKESLYDSTRKVFFSHYNERIFSFKKTYYLKLFEDTDNNPDISVCISCLLIDDYKDIILLQEDACSKLKDINESLINESLNKKEAIYRLIDEVPELFIKINNAISLDIMNICGLIKNQKFEEDKDTDFISLLGFNSDLDNMNTYNKFLEYSISLIRSINRSIVDDGFAQNIKERIFYKIMSSELFKNTEIETDIQIAHFVVFTNDKTIKKEFFNYNFNSDNIFVEVIVPIECYNACSYKEPSEKTDIMSKITDLFTARKQQSEILITPPFTIFKVLVKEDKYIQLMVEKDNQEYYSLHEPSPESENDNEEDPENVSENESISEENHNSISTYSREVRMRSVHSQK